MTNKQTYEVYNEIWNTLQERHSEAEKALKTAQTIKEGIGSKDIGSIVDEDRLDAVIEKNTHLIPELHEMMMDVYRKKDDAYELYRNERYS